MLSCSNSVGTPVKKDRRSSEILKRTSKRYQDTVLWVWFKMFFTPKRYKDPVLWVWLEMFFTPKRYQDPVLWMWLKMFFTPTRYQDHVLWMWLEMFFTPKRNQDPVLSAWPEMFCFSPLRGTNSKTTHYLMSYFLASTILNNTRKSCCCGPFEAEYVSLFKLIEAMRIWFFLTILILYYACSDGNN